MLDANDDGLTDRVSGDTLYEPDEVPQKVIHADVDESGACRPVFGGDVDRRKRVLRQVTDGYNRERFQRVLDRVQRRRNLRRRLAVRWHSTAIGFYADFFLFLTSFVQTVVWVMMTYAAFTSSIALSLVSVAAGGLFCFDMVVRAVLFGGAELRSYAGAFEALINMQLLFVAIGDLIDHTNSSGDTSGKITGYRIGLSFCTLIKLMIVTVRMLRSERFMQLQKLVALRRARRIHAATTATLRELTLSPADRLKQTQMDLVAALMLYAVAVAGIFVVLEQRFGDPASYCDNCTEIDLPFHDAIYFVVITASTIGYGDYAPTSGVSRLFVVVSMLVFIVTVPILYTRVQAAYRELRRLGGAYTPEGGPGGHVVVFVPEDGADGVDAFLSSFFRCMRDADYKLVVVLPPGGDAATVRGFVTSQWYHAFVHVLVGSPLSAGDTMRAKLVDAAAAVLLSSAREPHRSAERGGDVATLFKALAIKHRHPALPLFCVLGEPLLDKHKMWQHSLLRFPNVQLVAPDALRLSVLAESATCPGLTSLVANLVQPCALSRAHLDTLLLQREQSFQAREQLQEERAPSPLPRVGNVDRVADTLASSHDIDWYRDYVIGASHSIYAVPLSPAFAGMPFRQLVFVAWHQFDLAVVAVGRRSRRGVRVRTAPMRNTHDGTWNDLVVPSPCLVYVVARDQEHAESLLYWRASDRLGVLDLFDQQFGFARVAALDAALAPQKRQLRHVRRLQRQYTKSLQSVDSRLNAAAEETLAQQQGEEASAQSSGASLRAPGGASLAGGLNNVTMLEREKISIRGHILLCYSWSVGPKCAYFLSQLSRSFRGHVVLLAPRLSEKVAATLGGFRERFASLSFVRGRPRERGDLRRANTRFARRVFFLCRELEHPDEVEATGPRQRGTSLRHSAHADDDSAYQLQDGQRRLMLDMDAVYATIAVRSLPCRFHAVDCARFSYDRSRRIPLVVELNCRENLRFARPALHATTLSLSKVLVNSVDRQFRLGARKMARMNVLRGDERWPSVASGDGRISCRDTFGAALSSGTFANPRLPSVLYGMLGAGREASVRVRLLRPPRDFVGRPYAALCAYLVLARGAIPLGLMRIRCSRDGAPMSHVVTMPHKGHVLSHHDLVFVLAHFSRGHHATSGGVHMRRAPEESSRAMTKHASLVLHSDKRGTGRSLPGGHEIEMSHLTAAIRADADDSATSDSDNSPDVDYWLSLCQVTEPLSSEALDTVLQRHQSTPEPHSTAWRGARVPLRVVHDTPEFADASVDPWCHALFDAQSHSESESDTDVVLNSDVDNDVDAATRRLRRQRHHRKSRRQAQQPLNLASSDSSLSDDADIDYDVTPRDRDESWSDSELTDQVVVNDTEDEYEFDRHAHHRWNRRMSFLG